MAWHSGDYPTVTSLTDNDKILLAQSGADVVALLSTLKSYLAITGSNILNSDSTLAGTPGTLVETTLRTYAIPAATLSTDGWFIRAVYWGTCASGSDNKTVRVKFGSTTTSSGTGSITGGWLAETIIRRNAAGNQDMVTKFFGGKATTWNTAIGGVIDFQEPAENLNGAVNLLLTGENGFAQASLIRYEGSIILLNS